MATFYFNIMDSDGLTQGDFPYEYATLAEAVSQAKTVLSEMALDGIPRDDGSRLSVEVVDGSRHPLVTVSIELRVDCVQGDATIVKSGGDGTSVGQ